MSKTPTYFDRLRSLKDREAGTEESTADRKPEPQLPKRNLGKLPFKPASTIKDLEEEKVRYMPWQEVGERIKPFHSAPEGEGQPSAVSQAKLDQMRESVREHGILVATTVRPDKLYPGCLEMIAGHHRMRLAVEEQKDLPYISKPIDDDTAIIHMCDSNLQRGFDEMLPSEKCRWAVMRSAARKRRQGIRTDLHPVEIEENEHEKKKWNRVERQYIRLKDLGPELMQLLDTKKLGSRQGIYFSKLSASNQKFLYQYLTTKNKKVSEQQADDLVKLFLDDTLNTSKLDAFFQPKKTPVKRSIPKRGNIPIAFEFLRKYVVGIEKMSMLQLKEHIEQAVILLNSQE